MALVVTPIFGGGPFGSGPFGEHTRTQQLGTPDKSVTADAWDWFGDDYSNVVVPGAYQQSNAPSLPEDVWPHWDDHEGDDSIFLIVGDPVGPDSGVAPVVTLPQDEWPWDDANDADDDPWWFDIAHALVDATPQVDVVLQDDPDFAQDVGDDWQEESTPVGPDAPVVPDQPPANEWPWFEEPGDDGEVMAIVNDDDDPVGPDQPPQPVDDLPDDASNTGEDPWWFELAHALVDATPQVDIVLQDEPDFAQDVGDDWQDESGPVGLNAVVVVSQPVEDGPSFDGVDEDLDELVIDDFANFDPDPVPELDWNYEEESDDWWHGLAAAINVDGQAPQVDPPPDDAWLWSEDESQAHAVIPNGYQQADPEQLPGPVYAEAWDFNGEDTEDNAWWVEQNFQSVDAAAPVEIVLQDEPDFAEDVGDEWQDESAPVGADNPDPLPAFEWLEEEVSEDTPDESGPVGPDAVVVASQPPADEWLQEEVQDDLPDESGPVVADNVVLDQLPADEWPWFEDTGDEQIDDSAPVGPDAPVTADQPPADEWLFEEVTDDLPDESGPVGADNVVVEQPLPADEWLHEEVTDEAPEESGPVVADAVLVDALPADAWPWLDDDTGDEQPDDSAPVAEPVQADPPPDDAPLFESDIDDSLLLDEFRNEDEPAPPVADAFHWDEEPADDDAWWQNIEHPLVDFVQLPGPVYAEAWDFNGEDTEDDLWWLNLPQPDPAGLPANTCPAELAAALARIAELEALLAAALANAGTGGGGGGEGEDIVRYIQAAEDRKRAKIAANNALIMALVGSVVHGLKGPKGPK